MGNFEYRMYINGAFTDAPDGRAIEVIDPATGEAIREVAYGNADSARRAVDAAHAAFPGWSATNVYKRCELVARVAALMRENLESLAETLTREVGKPLGESRGELMGALSQFEWYAEEVKRRWGEWVPSSADNKRLITMRMPVGVAAAIAPWNFPALLLARKVAPALACGCTVVGRPASQTPLCTMEIWNLIHEAGFPDGVVNLVTGPPGEQSDVFVEDERVRKLSFTGSVPVGKELMKRCSERMKRLSLELGGHSPFIVCDDVSMAEAAERAVFGKFRNMGQVCISPSRFFVPESMYEEFCSEAARRTEALKIGNGLDPDTDVGPLHDALRVASTEALVEDIRAKGGKILCGGEKPTGPAYEKGFWFQPTVAAELNDEMIILNEEPFAPILPIIPYKDLDEAVAMANDTRFGLAAYLLTNDLGRAIRIGEALEAGIVGVNDPSPAAVQAPFGGMKESGMGREGGREGVDAYTEMKYLSIVI